MKIIILILFFLNFNYAYSQETLFSVVESAFIKNPRLNAERENFKAQKENINISKSEFLPSLTISGSQTNTDSTNRTNQSGSQLADTSIETQSKSISIDQKKYFRGLKI